jgi:hypothetical protein
MGMAGTHSNRRFARGLAALSLGATALGGVTTGGCELVTNAGDYEVRPSYEGWCTECSGSAGLRHPPCPPDIADGSDGRTYIFGARRMYLTAGGPDAWSGPNAESFQLGYDIDCSNRPDGQPVLCTPLDVDNPIAWAPMPHGIDNSTTQRVFGPLLETAKAAGQELDLDAEYSDDYEHGRLGVIVTIDEWNGEPDDPHVVVSVSSSPGTSESNGPPRWDGTDRWDTYNELAGQSTRFFRIQQVDGYVSGGVLVVDYRDRGDTVFTFGNPELFFEMIVNQVGFAGRLTKDELTFFTMSAVVDLARLLDDIPDLASILSACDPLGEQYLNMELDRLLVGAADMPRDPTAPPNQPCDGISFSWAVDLERVQLGGKRPTPDPGATCLGGF